MRAQIILWQCLRSQTNFHRDANNQKFIRNDGVAANQLRKAMAVEVPNFAQWLREHSPRSLPMRTVMPADAHAAANVRVDVTCTDLMMQTRTSDEKTSLMRHVKKRCILSAMMFFYTQIGQFTLISFNQLAKST